MIKDDLRIYIPSIGRPGDCIILKSIIPELMPLVRIVVPPEEVKGYQEADEEYIKQGMQVLGADVQGIANTRDWIIDNTETRYILMADDDVGFRKRNEENKLRACSLDDVYDSIKLLYKWMTEEEIPVAGYSSSFGNNWIKTDYVECMRPCRAYGIDTKTLKKLKIKFAFMGPDVCVTGEDYHMFLAVLEAGYKNRMTAVYTINGGDKPDGGCAIWRTASMIIEAMDSLKKLHEPYVSFRKEKGLTQRFDIGYEFRVQWKKAYKDGLKKREEKQGFGLVGTVDRRYFNYAVKGMYFKLRTKTNDQWIVDTVAKNNEYYRKIPWAKPTEDDVLFDGGGNIGAFAIAHAGSVKCIISIEAENENYALLQENIALNDLFNVTTINKALVGDSQQETAIIYANKKLNKGAHSLLVKRGRVGQVAKTITLDALYEEYKFNYLKLDIEGSELDVLTNFSYLNKIDVLTFEWHFAILRDWGRKELFKIFSKIKKAGFIIHEEPRLRIPNKTGYTVILCYKLKQDKQKNK